MRSVAVTGVQTCAIAIAGDKDVFAVTLTAGAPYTFNLDGSDVSATFTLRSAEQTSELQSRTHLVCGDDIEPSNWSSQITGYTAASSGTYYLEASSSPGDH